MNHSVDGDSAFFSRSEKATFAEILKLESMSQVSAPKKSIEALPQTKVAIIAPRDEPCSRTCQIPTRMFSNQKFSRNICPDESATLESLTKVTSILNRQRRAIIRRRGGTLQPPFADQRSGLPQRGSSRFSKSSINCSNRLEPQCIFVSIKSIQRLVSALPVTRDQTIRLQRVEHSQNFRHVSTNTEVMDR